MVRAAVTAISAVTVVTWLAIQPLGGGPRAPTSSPSPAQHSVGASDRSTDRPGGPGSRARRAPQCVQVEQARHGHASQPPQYSRASEWPLARFHARKLWAQTREGADVKVAVIDTGIDDTQPGLRGAIIGYCDVLAGRPGDLSKDSHGTAVAGLIAARGSVTSAGQMAGLAPEASLIDVRVTAKAASVTLKLIAEGIQAAVGAGARVINISLAVSAQNRRLVSAVRQAVAKGCLVVASVGDVEVPQFPADDPGVLRVGDIQPNGRPVDNLAGGRPVQGGLAIYAPGTGLFSTVATNGHVGVSGGYPHQVVGSGYATAYVSAAAALLLSADPRLSPAKAGQWLVSTATPVPGAPGFGSLDPLAALRGLREQNLAPVRSGSPHSGAWPLPPPFGPVSVLISAAILLLVGGSILILRRRATVRPVRPVPHTPSIWDEP